MLQLRNLLWLLRSASPLAAAPHPPLLSLHRPLSTAAPFAVQGYLVATCGLTRAQALKASKMVSHLRSPSKPDAAIAFLSARGLSRADIAAVVAADPKILCASVENNLSKRVAELEELGLSRSQIARLILVCRNSIRVSSIRRNIDFLLPILGSFDKLIEVVKMNSVVLTVNPDKVSKPNLALLQQCGIDASDLPTFMSRVLTRPHKIVRETVTLIDKIGVPRSSRMFYYALMSFAFQNKEKLAKKFGILEMYGWSQEDVLAAVRKMPGVVTMSDDRLRRNVEFLTRHVELEPPYIAQRPALIKYSLERRLLPRHGVLKVLKEKGLLDSELSFYSVAAMTENKFRNKFIGPYKERIPDLATIYASSFAEKVPN